MPWKQPHQRENLAILSNSFSRTPQVDRYLFTIRTATYGESEGVAGKQTTVTFAVDGTNNAARRSASGTIPPALASGSATNPSFKTMLGKCSRLRRR